MAITAKDAEARRWEGKGVRIERGGDFLLMDGSDIRPADQWDSDHMEAA